MVDERLRQIAALTALVVIATLLPRAARASTYIVFIPLESPIYEQLDTLNALGYLDDYLDEIKPISRVEAARLTLEARRNLQDSERPDPLASSMVDALRLQLSEEIGWLRSNRAEDLPTVIQPVDRVEAQYIFSNGTHRFWDTGGRGGLHAQEGTPLLPNNDGIPTDSGSNEVLRYSGWVGFGSFLTAYGEAVVAGPVTHQLDSGSRVNAIDAEGVFDLGNAAFSVGQEEMHWGIGHFAALSQGDNATPFPAARMQNIHPIILPWILKYMGQFRYQLFFGQLEGDRYFAHPWIDGQIFAFKPAPNFEIGFTHTVMFGGSHNNTYGVGGFVGRATGFATGSPSGANTNSRGGIYLKFSFPKLRNLQVYQEILGEDNLTGEIPGVGRFLPFLAVSYQGGFYLPRLTTDGLTSLRFEYAILEPNYSIHGDPLYWTYDGMLMADGMGPNATEVDISVGRWLPGMTKVSAEVFYTERAPTFGGNSPYPIDVYGSLTKEHSVGIAFDALRIPQLERWSHGVLLDGRARLAFEHVNHMNYGTADSFRTLVVLSAGITPQWGTLKW